MLTSRQCPVTTLVNLTEARSPVQYQGQTCTFLQFLCHPNPNSFSHSVAKRFVEGAQSVGHSIEFADLYAEDFDPILTERDLQQFKRVAMPMMSCVSRLVLSARTHCA